MSCFHCNGTGILEGARICYHCQGKPATFGGNVFCEHGVVDAIPCAACLQAQLTEVEGQRDRLREAAKRIVAARDAAITQTHRPSCFSDEEQKAVEQSWTGAAAMVELSLQESEG